MRLQDFAQQNTPKEGGDVFQIENSKILEVKLNGKVMAKAGSMISYTGDVSFERKEAGGLKGFLKKAATNEGSVTMEASGQGYLYLADNGKKVQVLQLGRGEKLSVNGNDILAFEEKINWDIETIGSLAGSASGGLFNVTLEGPGYIAITTHGDPLVLPTPVTTDPDATVAWSGNVSPNMKTDIGIKGFLGRNSGESFQLDFTGDQGFVVVQPFEEQQPQSGGSNQPI
ncbi:MAG: AIM24 family protein [Candidatus Nanohalobium sp.]